MFSSVSQEILERIHEHIRTWRTDHLSESLRVAIRDEFQKLEDEAVAAGLDDIATLSHGANRLLAQSAAAVGKSPDSDEVGLLNLFEEIYDGLRADLGFFPAKVRDHVQFLTSMVGSLLSDASPPPAEIKKESVQPPLATESNDTATEQMTATEPVAPEPVQPAPLIDIPAWVENHKLAELTILSDERSMASAHVQRIVENISQEIEALRGGLQAMRGCVGNLEYRDDNPEPRLGDAAELEALYQSAISATAQITELRAGLRAESYLAERVHAGLRATRLGTGNDYLLWLQRIVNETAERNNKQVEFSLRGGSIRLDRQVLESMLTPLKCLLRDSIEHSIEAAAQRTISGKPAVARIGINIMQQGAEWLLEYTDDGNGLAPEALAASAVAIGLCERAEQVGTQHLVQVITHPDYAATLPNSSGGLEAVYQSVRELGGTMAVQSEAGEGVRWQFHLPLTLLLPHVLLVAVGAYRFAILAHMIESLKRVQEAELVESNGQKYILIGAERIPVISLAAQLGEVNEASIVRKQSVISLVLLRVVDRIIALVVDEIQTMTTIVSKPLGQQPAAIRGVAGVGVLADSSIVAVLDPSVLVARTSLCEDGLIRFPLRAFEAAHAATDTSPLTRKIMQVVALQMTSGMLLIPLSMVAEVVGVQKLQPATSQCEWVEGEFHWSGLKVPLLNVLRAFDCNAATDQPCESVVILWPMKSGEADAFFAVTAPGYPTLLEIDSRLPATEPDCAEPMSTLLGGVQLDHCIGMIPDLNSMARQIF